MGLSDRLIFFIRLIYLIYSVIKIINHQYCEEFWYIRFYKARKLNSQFHELPKLFFSICFQLKLNIYLVLRFLVLKLSKYKCLQYQANYILQ